MGCSGFFHIEVAPNKHLCTLSNRNVGNILPVEWICLPSGVEIELFYPASISTTNNKNDIKDIKVKLKMKRDLGHGHSIYRMVIYTKLQFGRFLFKETPGAFYH